jgi:hypothetical protein
MQVQQYSAVQYGTAQPHVMAFDSYYRRRYLASAGHFRQPYSAVQYSTAAPHVTALDSCSRWQCAASARQGNSGSGQRDGIQLSSLSLSRLCGPVKAAIQHTPTQQPYMLQLSTATMSHQSLTVIDSHHECINVPGRGQQLQRLPTANQLLMRPSH